MGARRRVFPEAFKREAVERVTASGLSYPSPADLAAENARFRRENERLRMERDILKTYGPPRPQGGVKDGKMVYINVSGLKDEALAKMDIRAA